jgi:hypothetical protein
MAVVCYGGLAYFWTGVVPEVEVQVEQDLNDTVKEPNEVEAAEKVHQNINHNVDESTPSTPPPPQQQQEQQEYLIGNSDMEKQEDHEEDDNHDKYEISSSYVLISDRSTTEQLLSLPFLMAVTYSTIMITINQWALTVSRDFLASLGDDEVNNKYLTIFTLLLPASLIAVPFTDEIVARYGFHGGFQTVNALGLGYSLVRLLSDNLDVQIVGFILFSFFRCFLFGVAFSVLPVILSHNTVGKAMGITFGVAGLTSYVNIPLSRLAIDTKEGDFFIPNLIYTVVIIPSIALSWCLANAANKEIRIREGRNKRKTMTNLAE